MRYLCYGFVVWHYRKIGVINEYIVWQDRQSISTDGTKKKISCKHFHTDKHVIQFSETLKQLTRNRREIVAFQESNSCWEQKAKFMFTMLSNWSYARQYFREWKSASYHPNPAAPASSCFQRHPVWASRCNCDWGDLGEWEELQIDKLATGW